MGSEQSNQAKESPVEEKQVINEDDQSLRQINLIHKNQYLQSLIF